MTNALLSPQHPDTFRQQFLADLRHGLAQNPKHISSQYFYDELGSQLFERITTLPDYYLTRTETALLREVAPALAEACGEGVEVMEFGSGAGEKIRILLSALPNPASYTPIDISQEILAESAARLKAEYPALTVSPLCLDYTLEESWQMLAAKRCQRRIVFFPGSTIGNFTPSEAQKFLAKLGRAAGPGGAVLIGVDLQKDPSVLNAAYNDAEGVFAHFNLHILERIRDELGAQLPVDAFRSHIFYNEAEHRIQFELVSKYAHVWKLDGQEIPFADGEAIRTIESYKYTVEGFQALAQGARLHPARAWTDADRNFSLHLLETPKA